MANGEKNKAGPKTGDKARAPPKNAKQNSAPPTSEEPSPKTTNGGRVGRLKEQEQARNAGKV